MVKSLRDMAALACSSEFASLGVDFFAVKFSARLRSLNQATPRNRFISNASLLALDWLPGGRAFLKLAMPGGPNASDIASMDDRDLEALALEYVAPAGHHVGTCRMGTPNDPSAVVDTQGKVNGVHGLRVIDASIMPDIPRGNTNLPTLMIAEKLADGIRRSL
jgi:5-(hydroxymethyl)furfural/furfural oxidase